MGGATLKINIQAVGLYSDGDHFSAEFMHHMAGNMIGSAVCAIDYDF